MEDKWKKRRDLEKKNTHNLGAIQSKWNGILV